jgi:hypothetical protein
LSFGRQGGKGDTVTAIVVVVLVALFVAWLLDKALAAASARRNVTRSIADAIARTNEYALRQRVNQNQQARRGTSSAAQHTSGDSR